MNQPYLEVTYRRGRALAAYYYLPRRPGDTSHRSRRVEPGLIIDFARDGNPIGIEITSSSLVTVAAMNRVLKGLSLPPVRRGELAPLRAAS